MLFNSLVFLFLFLPIVYFGFWRLRTKKQRYIWLTVASYIFYGTWNYKFCALMAFSTAVSYFAGSAMLGTTDPRRRKLFLIIPVTIDLLLLGFFKYFNFTVSSFAELSAWLHVPIHPPALNIILPVGISFYTFHTISYMVDAYRGVITPTRNFWEFSCYVSLFSQLVAGPIVRFRQVEADLDNLDHADRTRWLNIGWSFFAIGMMKKVLLADTIAAVINPAWKDVAHLSTLGAWLCVLGYTYQIYFDFSGYSDMAVGLGYLFGIRLPQNFNSPYKALNIADFWRRWHISLSTCLRDYLYIPLGGSRVSSNWLVYRNLSDHDAPRRSLARRQLDLRILGRLSRRIALSLQAVRQVLGSSAGRCSACRHVFSRSDWLGFLSFRQFLGGGRDDRAYVHFFCWLLFSWASRFAGGVDNRRRHRALRTKHL